MPIITGKPGSGNKNRAKKIRRVQTKAGARTLEWVLPKMSREKDQE